MKLRDKLDMILMVGCFTILIFSLILSMVCPVFSMERDGFTVNIRQDGYQVKEISNIVSLPFYSEYQLSLKNTHNRRATARVFIDGIPVSKLGDIVIPSGGKIDLERFLDRSLNEGKRFKFVPITHPEVDDPNNKENGKVKVEFRLEKKYQPQIHIVPEQPYRWQNPGNILYDSFFSTSINCNANVTSTSSAGATIGGNESYQRFTEISLDMEEQVFVVELKIIGI